MRLISEGGEYSVRSWLYQNRSLAADTQKEDSKISAIYYYDPETDSEYLLWKKS